MKKFKAKHPEYYGLPSDYELIFDQTKKGYKAELPAGADGTWSWLGFPAVIIENSLLFEDVTPPPPPPPPPPKPKRDRIKIVQQPLFTTKQL